MVIAPRGPMDKASAHGAGDCRFEPCRCHIMLFVSILKLTNPMPPFPVRASLIAEKEELNRCMSPCPMS